MKKILSLILALAMVFSLAACGGKTEGGKNETEAPEETKYTPSSVQAKVNNPTVWPVYALDENATVDEMRKMAVQAMKDSISVKWTPVQHFSYAKTGAGDSYDYQFDPVNVYAGILYASGGAGLFQWLACIDPETGILYDANFSNMGSTQGSSCSAAVCWGLAPVSSKLKGIYSTYYINPSYGFVKLGNIKYPDNLKNYKEYSTKKIVEDNDRNTIYESYALLLPGDPVVSSGDGSDAHAMMVIEPAAVVRNADGTIDAEKSIITVADQRFKDTAVQEDDQSIYYRGRKEAAYTFAELAKLSYLAMSIPEFQGTAKYEKATASLNKEATDLKTLQGTRIQTNYFITVATATVTDAKGKKVIENKHLTVGEEINAGTAKMMPMSQVLPAGELKRLEPGDYKCNIEVAVATGEKFIVADLDFKVE